MNYLIFDNIIIIIISSLNLISQLQSRKWRKQNRNWKWKKNHPYVILFIYNFGIYKTPKCVQLIVWLDPASAQGICSIV